MEYVFEFFGEISSYFGASYISYFLSQAGDKPVRMKLSSYGGDVPEALVCAEKIRSHGNVTIQIVGKCASAATILCFAAKKIEMNNDAFYLIHNCSQWVSFYGSMNKEAIADKIKELENTVKSGEAIDLVLTSKYVDRSPKTVDEITNLMKENRWISADSAKEWGFIDEVIPTDAVRPKDGIKNEIKMLSALGLPSYPSDKEDPAPKKTFEEKMENIFSKFFNKMNNNPNPNPVMNKKFAILNALLKVEGFNALTDKEESLEITAEQLQLIEDSLSSSATALADANVKADTAEAQLTAITNAVDTLSPTIKNAAGDEKIKEVKAIFARIPSYVVPIKREYKEGETDFSDVATDPANFEED